MTERKKSQRIGGKKTQRIEKTPHKRADRTERITPSQRTQKMPGTKYTLVLQWPAKSVSPDELAQREEVVERAVDPHGMTDGHDHGAAANLFILTDDPRLCFEEARAALGERAADVKAAYCETKKEDSFTIIWPPGETSFRIS
jgi:hypothetical protein